jgi:expansin (peptidoglycan-binding protein)
VRGVVAILFALAGCGGEADPRPASDGGSAGACVDPQERSGEATYYDADGSGNCSFDPSPDDLMVAAMNEADYAGSDACGACAAVDGPSGQVVVRIVDRCPGCPAGDIDLSPQAFERVAELSAGRVPITWRHVACDVEGPIRYRFKEGTNPFWTAIQVRNHRHAIASLEARLAGGGWEPVGRESYNYFVQPDGLGEGPFDLRVTDVHGHALEDIQVVPGDGSAVEGESQLPSCSP